MNSKFWLTYVLLVIAQAILYNYCHFTPYLILTILPVIVLCIPTSVGTNAALLIAFATGLAVDYFAEGALGINAASLVPIALIRRPLIGLMFGSEPFERKENINAQKYGFTKVSLAFICVTAIFLAIYILIDCAGTRPAWFIMLTLVVSVFGSYLLSITVINLLAYDDRR